MQDLHIGAPVLALEWVGDMSAPSILSARCVSSATTPQVSGLDTWFLESESKAETGTVLKSVSPTKSPTSSPIPLAQGPDLFTTSLPEFRLSSSRNPSSADLRSPEVHPVKRRRKFYPRPRIATETFNSPSSLALSSSPPLCSQTSPLTRPESLAWKRPRSPPRIPSPPFTGSVAVQCSPSEYSHQEEDDERFFTAVSRRVSSPFQRISRTTSKNIGTKQPIETESRRRAGVVGAESAGRTNDRSVPVPAPSSLQTGISNQDYDLREETERLRLEMQNLRSEFALLRETILEGKK